MIALTKSSNTLNPLELTMIHQLWRMTIHSARWHRVWHGHYNTLGMKKYLSWTSLMVHGEDLALRQARGALSYQKYSLLKTPTSDSGYGRVSYASQRKRRSSSRQ